MDIGMIQRGNFQRKEAHPDFKDSSDAVVVGLGTAGKEAALCAAAFGLKTLGVEKQIAMGGQSTIGCVWFQGKGPAPAPDPADVLKNHHTSFPIQRMSIPERMALYEREADEVGLDLSYETFVVGVYLEDHCVKGVRLCRNGVVCDIAARIVMDCTGNGSVARMAGCRMILGRKFDQGQAAISKAIFQENRGGQRPRYGFFRDNPVCSAQEYSNIIERISRKWPALWNARASRVLLEAVIPGMREEGHVETEEFITLRDCLAGKPVQHPIFHTFEPLDLVRIDEDWAFEDEDVQTWKALCGLLCFGFFASLPYGTLLPKNIDSLLVPSKHFGVAHDAGSGIRMMADMRKTGIAAACATVLSIRMGVPLRNVPYDRLKKMLDSCGVTAFPRKREISLWSSRGTPLKLFSNEEIITALKQDVTPPDSWIFRAKNGPRERAAYAYCSIWMANFRRSPEERKFLAEMLFSEMEKKGRFAGNFAVALGLLGDRRACPVLRGIVSKPGAANPEGCDPVIPDAYPNRIKALCLLGRLGDREAISLLRDLVLDDALSFTVDLPVNGKQKKTRDQYRFDALSFALFSLVSLLRQYPDSKVQDALLAWKKQPFVLPAGRDQYDCAPMLKRILDSLSSSNQ